MSIADFTLDHQVQLFHDKWTSSTFNKDTTLQQRFFLSFGTTPMKVLSCQYYHGFYCWIGYQLEWLYIGGTLSLMCKKPNVFYATWLVKLHATYFSCSLSFNVWFAFYAWNGFQVVLLSIGAAHYLLSMGAAHYLHNMAARI